MAKCWMCGVNGAEFFGAPCADCAQLLLELPQPPEHDAEEYVSAEDFDLGEAGA